MKWMSFAISAIIAATAAALAQQAPSVTPMTPEMNPAYAYTRPEADFVRKTAMIPMRDGKRMGAAMLASVTDSA